MNSVLLRSSCSFINSQCSHGFVKFATKLNSLRPISSTARALKKDDYPAPPDPVHRTLNTLYNDLKAMKSRILQINAKDIEEPEKLDAAEFQTHCDVLILGGGGTGSAISYWLKKRARDGLKVVVVENDTVYTNSSCMGLNQQFSLPENIQIANYSAEFMRNIKEKLGDLNLNFTPCGTLILSSSEEDAEVLRRISKIQNELSVRNEILSQEKIKSRFPWMKTDDIILGYHSLENDGCFDPFALLFGFRNKAREYGAHFVEAELVDFEFQVQSNVLVDKEEGKSYNSLDKVVLRMPNGEIRTIKFALCVIATESKTNDVCRLARIGCAPGILSVPLPVESRKRYSSIFNLRDSTESIFLSPLTVDPNGTCFRQEGLGGNYFCSRNLNNSNTEEKSPDVEVLKTLRNRVPAFQHANILESWVDSYEINTFDDNGIIGPHPYYNNLYLAVGFNAHGIQQTPAIARAMSELIIDGQFRTIDLTRLGFDRLMVDQPLYEMISA